MLTIAPLPRELVSRGVIVADPTDDLSLTFIADYRKSDDDCCADNAPCIGGQCCCDGCRGTVVCGGTCCSSGSCCNGACCGSGQVCAESSPGVRSCVAAERNCVSDAQCYPGEICWGNVCCTAERMCREPNGPGLVNPVCCATSHYCDAADVCCPNGGDCSTGRSWHLIHT